MRILGPTLLVESGPAGWTLEWRGDMAPIDVYVDTYESYPVAHFDGISTDRLHHLVPRTDPAPQRLLLLAESGYKGLIALE